jgi:glycosyltransferase involved in cell wall biosynthesis
MACEVPVVATNVGGVPEVVTDGEDGYLVAPGDVEAAAARAIEILRRPDRGRFLGQQARQNAMKRYCASKIIPQYEAFYQKILSAAARV